MKEGDIVWYWTREKGKGARRQWGWLVSLDEKYAFVDLQGSLLRVRVNRDRLRRNRDAPEALRRHTR